MKDVFNAIATATKPRTSKCLVMQKDTDSINKPTLLISANAPDLWDYVNSGFIEKKEGSQADCLDWLDNYWHDNNIGEDERILLTSKK